MKLSSSVGVILRRLSPSPEIIEMIQSHKGLAMTKKTFSFS
jgi:hypothetical protein